MWYFAWILGTCFASFFAMTLALWKELKEPSSDHNGFTPH